MGALWLHDLPEALNGLPNVSFYDGWELRSRASGGYTDLMGIAVHHTASSTSQANDLSYMWDSTSGDQPIGAIYLGRDGAIVVGCAGATNCVGKGGPYETSRGIIPLDDGNARSLSIEAANSGVGEPWPDIQQTAYVALVSRLCEWYGLWVSDTFAHYEWTTRKVDPAGPSQFGMVNSSMSWDMDIFRETVSDYLGPVPPIDNSRDDMATCIMVSAEHNAQFIGTGTLLADGTVHVVFATWFGPGEPTWPNNPFLANHSGAPDIVVQSTNAETFRDCIVLLGDPTEIDDSKHNWTEADFYRVVR